MKTLCLNFILLFRSFCSFKNRKITDILELKIFHRSADSIFHTVTTKFLSPKVSNLHVLGTLRTNKKQFIQTISTFLRKMPII